MFTHIVKYFGIALAIMTVASADGATGLAEQPSRPNIVFILADDLGLEDLGSCGNQFHETPHIDRIWREGIAFPYAYSNGPNCAPTRASLMSGQYGPRHGIYTVGSGARGKDEHRRMVPPENVTNLPRNIVTIADVLHSAGYATGCFGKWHLGSGPEFSPTRRGFDVAVERDEKHPHPASEFLAEAASKFIRENAARPFFAYIPFHAVHVPLAASQPLIDKYKKKLRPGENYNVVYAAMLEELDRAVGRILGTLDELKIADNTLVIFCSDNGGVGGYSAAGIRGAKELTRAPSVRGGKGMLYEGGIRIPLIVRWPPVINPNCSCHEPVATIDFYPTFLELTGARAPNGQTSDGVSILKLLESSGEGQLLERPLFWHFPGYLEADVERGTWRTTPGGAIRHGHWKLIESFETGCLELYNLLDDPGETHDLAGKMAEQTNGFYAELAAWRKLVNAPMPQMKETK